MDSLLIYALKNEHGENLLSILKLSPIKIPSPDFFYHAEKFISSFEENFKSEALHRHAILMRSVSDQMMWYLTLTEYLEHINLSSIQYITNIIQQLPTEWIKSAEVAQFCEKLHQRSVQLDPESDAGSNQQYFRTLQLRKIQTSYWWH